MKKTLKENQISKTPKSKENQKIHVHICPMN